MTGSNINRTEQKLTELFGNFYQMADPPTFSKPIAKKMGGGFVEILDNFLGRF